MRPTEALATLARMGLTLRPRNDGKLIVTPVASITPEARALIVEHRDGLFAVLCAADAKNLPSASPANPRSIGTRVSAYHERLATCLEAGDIAEVDAHNTAATDAGDTLDRLADLQAAEWRQRLAGMLAPVDVRLARLRADLIALAGLPWLVEAARLGWTDEDLFGCASPDPFAPGADLARGFAVYVALAPWNRPPTHRCRVVRIEADRAKFQTPSGVQFGFQRFTAALDRPIWTVPAFSPPTHH